MANRSHCPSLKLPFHAQIISLARLAENPFLRLAVLNLNGRRLNQTKFRGIFANHIKSTGALARSVHVLLPEQLRESVHPSDQRPLDWLVRCRSIRES